MSETIVNKICSTCQILKPTSEFYTRGRSGSFGYQCKSCESQRKKEKHERKRAPIRKLQLAQKLIDDTIVAQVSRIEIKRRDVQRIIKHINANVSGCWDWQRKTNTGGYGQPTIRVQKQSVGILAHRLMYALYYLQDPRDLCVLHRCDNRLCCNPLHLFLGTNLDNIQDKINKGRQLLNTVRGEQSKKTSFTAKQVLQLRTNFAQSTLSVKKFSKQQNLPRSTVYNIISRRTWKHI